MRHLYAAAASRTVATLPMPIAVVRADDLNLEIIKPPMKLPKIDIYQYWHDRFHRDPGSRWIRGIFASLFRTAGSRGTSR